MGTEFAPRRLNQWLRDIATTEDDEIDCDAFAGALESVLEAGIQGYDLRAAYPKVAVHLAHCPDCREWFAATVEVSGLLE